ncbi:hypothetical protein LTR02_017708 [Friedmanniomyces endolithicus]|nr:hypothetical protein LTR02_017708 [Friedmanniomyces endolithicus]
MNLMEPAIKRRSLDLLLLFLEYGLDINKEVEWCFPPPLSLALDTEADELVIAWFLDHGASIWRKKFPEAHIPWKTSPPLKSLYSSLISAATEDTITLWGNSTSHKAIVIRAFHPSVYLRDDYIEAEKWSQDEVLLANKILRLCFAKAFRTLSGEPCAEDDREEALLQAWKDTVGARNRSRALKEISRNANLQNQVPLVLADKMGALSIGGK